MKTPGYYILLFAGVFLMAFFGSEITTTIAPPKSWLGHFLLPGYSVGLITISAAMYTRLSSQMRDLRSKVEKIESAQS